jgi:hypothetical protein
LLYWYKSTHTDAEAPQLCRTGITVYLLYWYKSTHTDAEAPQLCRTGITVYLLYWYKSTHTDAEVPQLCRTGITDAAGHELMDMLQTQVVLVVKSAVIAAVPHI